MSSILFDRRFRAAVCLLCALLLCTAFLPGLRAWADTEEEVQVPDYVPPAELAACREQNAHVIALLNVPGAGICYPILQHPTEKDYYLNITIDGDEGYPGSIYTNPIEGQDFATFNTVIYGHNMRDGSFFGSLKSYRDPEFRDSHREIDIYTESEKHVYDVFAVVVYDDRYITANFKDDNEADRERFLESLNNGYADTVVLDDVEVNADSHIITLSTCISDMHDNRLLVVAVEREDGGT